VRRAMKSSDHPEGRSFEDLLKQTLRLLVR